MGRGFTKRSQRIGFEKGDYKPDKKMCHMICEQLNTKSVLIGTQFKSRVLIMYDEKQLVLMAYGL